MYSFDVRFDDSGAGIKPEIASRLFPLNLRARGDNGDGQGGDGHCGKHDQMTNFELLHGSFLSRYFFNAQQRGFYAVEAKTFCELFKLSRHLRLEATAIPAEGGP